MAIENELLCRKAEILLKDWLNVQGLFELDVQNGNPQLPAKVQFRYGGFNIRQFNNEGGKDLDVWVPYLHGQEDQLHLYNGDINTAYHIISDAISLVRSMKA